MRADSAQTMNRKKRRTAGGWEAVDGWWLEAGGIEEKGQRKATGPGIRRGIVEASRPGLLRVTEGRKIFWCYNLLQSVRDEENTRQWQRNTAVSQFVCAVTGYERVNWPDLAGLFPYPTATTFQVTPPVRAVVCC